MSGNEDLRGKSSGVLIKLAAEAVADSERWFPDLQNSKGAVSHHALALCGEAGEFANVVKKIQRGSLDPSDPHVQWMLRKELTDVFIYTLNLAGVLGLDLEAANAIVRQENEQRFGDPGGASHTTRQGAPG